MDLDVSISPLVTREFTDVALTGFGAELIPLTSDYGDKPCPKALLPVANEPMITIFWLDGTSRHEGCIAAAIGSLQG
ncbi:hypothetical protein ARMGADRAFT_483441 [Armillaria gallica]|uniref:Uncharacterized protein n=1 Tax=Armillaria gallica TaxID=47427 RepID=A0A2H3EEU9_ARMGA|nr:hypothetical protein ARMGADRAFT_483441 [Armillaria gallica]